MKENNDSLNNEIEKQRQLIQSTRKLCVDYDDIVEQEMKEKQFEQSLLPKQIEFNPPKVNHSDNKLSNKFWDLLG